MWDSRKNYIGREKGSIGGHVTYTQSLELGTLFWTLVDSIDKMGPRWPIMMGSPLPAHLGKYLTIICKFVQCRKLVMPALAPWNEQWSVGKKANTALPSTRANESQSWRKIFPHKWKTLQNYLIPRSESFTLFTPFLTPFNCILDCLFAYNMSLSGLTLVN